MTRSVDPMSDLRWTEGTLLEAQTLAHVGVWEWRVDSGHVQWSPELYRMYGFEADAGRTPEQDLQRVAATVLPQDWPLLAAARDAALTRGESFDFELRIIREDGEHRTLHAVGRVDVDPQTGKTTRILGTTQDITPRKSAEAALGESEKRFRAAFDNAPIGMALVGLDGRMLRVNRAAAALFGRPVAELTRMNFRELTHPEDLAENLGLVEAMLRGESDGYTMEKRYLRPDGEVFWAELSVSLVRDDNGEPDYVLSQVQDVSEPRRLREHLHHLADHDALTGLLNRRSFDRALKLVDANGTEAAVAVIDLDNFKQVNDRFGHHEGDRVLETVATTIRQRLRRMDFAARLGGDEFALLLLDVDLEAAATVAELLADSVTKAAGHGVGCSVGVARVGGGEDAAAAMRAADRRMYKRKHAGRSRQTA
jgi:diguanylate cyclase (GGDEF)-like protein/PAS domain S-box-containing protein